MKNLLIIIALICFANSQSFAQHTLRNLHDLEFYMKTSDDYKKHSNENGPIQGSPYLTEKFKQGELLLNDTSFKEIKLRYDLYYDRFEVKLDSGIMLIDPIRNEVDTIKYNEEIFVRKVFDSGKSRRVAFVVLLGESNKFSVCKQYRINVSSATRAKGYSDPKPAEFRSTSPAYYVFSGADLWELKGTKSIAVIFNQEAKAVKNYLKENKYKLSKEHDLIEVVSYFSSL